MRTLYKTLVILGVASVLNAATTYVSTITGTRVVTGYFNETNDVTIIITLDGDDADGESADKSEQYIELYVGFNTSATVSTIATQMSGLSRYKIIRQVPPIYISTTFFDCVIVYVKSIASISVTNFCQFSKRIK